MSFEIKDVVLDPLRFFHDLEQHRRADYINHLILKNLAPDEVTILNTPDLVVAIQRDWHMRGLQGCRFAVFMSKRLQDVGWLIIVVSGDKNRIISQESIRNIGDITRNSIADPKIKAISFIFPTIDTVSGLVKMINSLNLLDEWSVEKLDGRVNISGRPELVNIAIRVKLNSDGVFSWPLGFGPFEFFGMTRQSPFTEIALAVKPKELPLYHRITPDLKAAHLADVKLPLEDRAFDTLWESTEGRKKQILKGFNDPTTKAKVTFAIPADLWHD